MPDKKRFRVFATSRIGDPAENRLRERLIAKYSTRTPAEAKRLEKEIEKLVQIYAEGRILLQGDPSDRIRRDHRLQGKEQTREIDITDNQ